MNILVTGAKGFVGRNLCETLKTIRDGKDKSRDIDSDINIFEYDIDTEPSLLDEYCSKCDFVFHLAGVNRPKDVDEFMKGNFGFTSTLLDTLKKHNNASPVMISSSIQAELDNPYGLSKKAGEDLLFKYSKETGAKVLVYRFPNLFGKWSRPNYNSVIATFCNNIASGTVIKINDASVELSLAYIDDVIDELILALEGKEHMQNNYCYVVINYKITLGRVVELLYSFKESRIDKSIPDFSDSFTNKLYATYLSYLPKDKFSYPLKMNIDDRGSFTEILRTIDRGQFSVNISKPGITKGQHWHHTKNEKFVVVSGSGLIQFRKIGSEEIINYHVSGDKIEVVDIPTGYTHNIINEGETDLVTFMWANKCFNPNKPDTFFEKV
jgi:UDP-2-acetamido-2,6-beta-L-arabino-hexul-4-ose reductase